MSHRLARPANALLLSVAAIAGIGFTVSLLISGLALGQDVAAEAKAAVMIASLVSALLGAVVLRGRTRRRVDLGTAAPLVESR